MSLYAMLAGKGPSGFGYGSTAEDVTAGISLKGKSMLVTGVASGLGLETLRVLTMRGAHVLGTARLEAKAREACASVRGSATPFACDLTDPSSVRACVERVNASGVQLDAIVCNAGIMAPPRRESAFGYELQFFTNHVGHFLLTTGLVDRLATDGRVVVVSGHAHRNAPKEGIRFDDLGADKHYDPWMAYGQSKLANLLFVNELARRFAGTRRTANALHPGIIATRLSRHMGLRASIFFAVTNPIALKSVAQGAATQCYLAAHPAVATTSGKYFADCNVVAPRPDAEDLELAKRLWQRTEEILAKLPT